MFSSSEGRQSHCFRSERIDDRCFARYVAEDPRRYRHTDLELVEVDCERRQQQECRNRGRYRTWKQRQPSGNAEFVAERQTNLDERLVQLGDRETLGASAVNVPSMLISLFAYELEDESP